MFLTADDLDVLWQNGDIDLQVLTISECLGAPLRSSSGKIFGVIAVFSVTGTEMNPKDDTALMATIAAQVSMATERKRTEQVLKYSQARYRALMEQSFEALAVIDIQTQEVVEVNRRFSELFGYALPQDSPLYVYQFVAESRERLDHLEWNNGAQLLRGFLIDVSGHGLATAIQKSSINVLLREAAKTNLPLLGQMRRVNARSTKYFTEDTYVAMLGFEIDLLNKELRFVGAGITQFYYNGVKIETPGMFVGIWPEADFTLRVMQLELGDSIHFLTDGFTDELARPENGNFWSQDGRDFASDVNSLEQLVETGVLRDDATGICLQIRQWA